MPTGEYKDCVTMLPYDEERRIASFQAKSPGVVYFNITSPQTGTEVLKITVKQPSTALSVTPKELTVRTGDSADLKAVFTPANSTDTIIWKSYNNSVATVDVNGRVTGAKAGTLSILVGGNKEDYEACMPLFEAMGTNINYQGEAGCGQHAKMVNQIMIAGTMSGLCEALSYAKAKDLDCETVLKSVATGAAGSKQLDFFGEKILHGDYNPGFFMKHFIKDMKIALIEANQCELDLDVLSQTLANYEVLEAEGYGDLGTQALIKYYEEGYNEEIIED